VRNLYLRISPIKKFTAILCLILSVFRLTPACAHLEVAELCENTHSLRRVSLITEQEETEILSRASISTVNNRGNMEKMLKEQGSKQNVRSLVMVVAAAGLTYGIGDSLGISQLANAPLNDSLQKTAVQTAVSTGLALGTGEKNLGEIAVQGVRSVVTSVAGAGMSNQIKDWYTDGILNFITHKVAHAGAGAVEGAIFSKDSAKGAAAGAIGAFVAETVGDSLPQSMDINTRRNIALLTAATTAFLMGQDVNTAILAATIALENNFMTSEDLADPKGKGKDKNPDTDDKADNTGYRASDQYGSFQEYIEETQAEERGRTFERVFDSCREHTPPPLPTLMREGAALFQSGIQTVGEFLAPVHTNVITAVHNEAQATRTKFLEELLQKGMERVGEFLPPATVAKFKEISPLTTADIARVVGAYALDFPSPDRLIKNATNLLAEGTEFAAENANTSIRRFVREQTGSQWWGQNAGDAAYLGIILAVDPAKGAGKGLSIANKMERLVLQGVKKGTREAANVASHVPSAVGKTPTITTTPLPQNLNPFSAEKRTLEALDLNHPVKVHKNSLQYVGDTHIYAIREMETGIIQKYGESALGKNKFGQSLRAQSQVTKLQRETGKKFESFIVKEHGDKKGARLGETKRIETYRKIFGQNTLPLNKGKR